jgi:hypothetical protein
MGCQQATGAIHIDYELIVATVTERDSRVLIEVELQTQLIGILNAECTVGLSSSPFGIIDISACKDTTFPRK